MTATDKLALPDAEALCRSLADRIRALLSFHASFLDGAFADMTADETRALAEYLSYCLEGGNSLDYLAECYAVVVEDTFEAQVYFQKHGRYKFSTFAEVNGIVYDNPVYMEKYMYGLAITSFIWPNHRKILDFFLRTIPKTERGRYLEVGPGHGYFFLNAVRRTAYDRFLAVDVSPKSIELTTRICRTMEPGRTGQIEFVLADFLATRMGDEPFDAIVMGEVLEHVEQPQAFLDRLWSLSKPGGFVFMTTCINSPAIDHISLFSSTEQVEDMIGRAGFSIAERLYVPYVGKTLAQSAEMKLPVNVAFSLVRG